MMPFQKNGQSGMSLIEVMVALVVLGLTSAALMGLFLAGSTSTAVARHDVAAVNVAQEILEQVKAVPENQFGTARGGGIDTIQLATQASEVNNYYSGLMIATTGGRGSGQVRKITDYNGATRTATVERPWDTVPDATTTYAILKGTASGYMYRIGVVPNPDPTKGLATVTVTVSYATTGGRTREVTLTSERLSRW